jgi:hypothetical protein
LKYQIGDTRFYVEPVAAGFEVLEKRQRVREGEEKEVYEFRHHFGTLQGLLDFLPGFLLASMRSETPEKLEAMKGHYEAAIKQAEGLKAAMGANANGGTLFINGAVFELKERFETPREEESLKTAWQDAMESRQKGSEVK